MNIGILGSGMVAQTIGRRLVELGYEVKLGSRSANTVRELLSQFGWLPEEFVDLGGISASRGAEAYLLLWLRMWGAKKTGTFNLKIVDEKASTP